MDVRLFVFVGWETQDFAPKNLFHLRKIAIKGVGITDYFVNLHAYNDFSNTSVLPLQASSRF